MRKFPISVDQLLKAASEAEDIREQSLRETAKHLAEVRCTVCGRQVTVCRASGRDAFAVCRHIAAALKRHAETAVVQAAKREAGLTDTPPLHAVAIIVTDE